MPVRNSHDRGEAADVEGVTAQLRAHGSVITHPCHPPIQPASRRLETLLAARLGREPLGGNFTLVGSVANLIVAHRAANRGIALGFWTYFKVGAPLTLLTLAFGILWL
jgi:Na+/H+ antiporter NhaD/arsenite permease-like protein